MRPIDDPSSPTPDERLAEVAGILAAGILRLHTRVALSPDAADLSVHKNPAKSAAPGLEVPDETGVTKQNARQTTQALTACKNGHAVTVATHTWEVGLPDKRFFFTLTFQIHENMED